MKLRVGGAQIPVFDGDIRKNKENIINSIKSMSENNLDFLVTPEGALSGYTISFDSNLLKDALGEVVEKVKEYKTGLILGTCYKNESGENFNQSRIYSKDGSLIGIHSKILRCGDVNNGNKGEVKDYLTTDLKAFEWKGFKFGSLICNDMWANPSCTPMDDNHLSQKLAKMGAKIIFHSVHCGHKGDAWGDVIWSYHKSNLQMRARAGGLWIVTANISENDEGKMGPASPSGIIDTMGSWILKAGTRGNQLFWTEIEV